jgi:hypothetical protein
VTLDGFRFAHCPDAAISVDEGEALTARNGILENNGIGVSVGRPFQADQRLFDVVFRDNGVNLSVRDPADD